MTSGIDSGAIERNLHQFLSTRRRRTAVATTVNDVMADGPRHFLAFAFLLNITRKEPENVRDHQIPIAAKNSYQLRRKHKRNQ